MDLEKQKRTLIHAAYYGVILLGIYLGCHFLLPALMPFVLGFVAAWILRRPAVFFAEKFRITQKVPAALFTALFYFLTAAVILLAGSQLISVLRDLLPRLPEVCTNQLLPFLNDCVDNIKEFASQVDLSIADGIEVWAGHVSSSLMQAATSFSGSVVRFISGVAAGMPMMIVRIVLTVVSTFFISMDFERIVRFLKKLLPDKVEKAAHPIKEKAFHSLKIFLRSYTWTSLLTSPSGWPRCPRTSCI